MKKDLLTIDGTVASVLNSRLNEIDFNAPIGNIKADIIKILQDPSIKQKDLAERYIREISTKTNMSHLLSTITTYLTGDKLGKSRGYTRKYS